MPQTDPARHNWSGMPVLLVAVASTAALRAETGYDAWVRYAAIDQGRIRQSYDTLPATVVTFGDSAVIQAACGD